MFLAHIKSHHWDFTSRRFLRAKNSKSSGRITPTKRTEELVKNFYAADYEAFDF